MTIKMDKKTFDNLTVETVGHACFEPLVPVYQGAMREKGEQDSQEIMKEFYMSLTPGQRALMFYSYYDHAVRSKDEFEMISRHYLFSGIFGIVKKAAAYFCDDDMSDFLSKVEITILGNEQNKVSELYGKFCEISLNTLSIIGTQVKNNPEEFICFE